jgi:hypothetical protein
MPAKSGPQYRFMAGIAHGMKPRGGDGPSKAVAEEFVHATPPAKRSAWAKKRKGNKYKKLAHNMR